ncbi:patatin-like phospholipase family protein [Marinoscillum sp.]|uniref:patatin-like phospholipase family protein n=1 Tax=Marinoscillum sp. TaxID=2024838 RepID=UPI003BA9DEF1
MKIGLVLSGGGARGVAHLGIMEALLEAGISFSVVSGSSAGALAGSLYCAGYTPKEIAGFIQKTNFITAFRPSFNSRSLLNIERAHSELIKYFKEDSFESLQIPLRVTTTDISKGKVKVYKKGQLIRPVLASCCVPVVFDPVKIGRRTLVDGGILDNLPYKPIKKECDKIIALHCNPIDKGYRISNWRDLMERSMMLTVTQYVHSKKKNYDLFLEPPGVSKYKVFDFKRAPEIFEHGYSYAKEQIASGVLDKLEN